jgi:hypothetical protein
MINLGYVLAVGLLGWVGCVHAARLIRHFRPEIERRIKERKGSGYAVVAE